MYVFSKEEVVEAIKKQLKYQGLTSDRLTLAGKAKEITTVSETTLKVS